MLQAKPKWFMGYSDNTNLTFLLTTLCDTAAIYGPLAQRPSGWCPGTKPFRTYIELLREKTGIEGYSHYETNPNKDADHPLNPMLHGLQERSVPSNFEKGLLPKGRGAENWLSPAG